MFTDTLATVLNTMFQTNVTGIDKLDLSKPSIIMPNHTSLADVVVLSHILPKDIYFVSNSKSAKRYASLIKGRNVITIDPLNPYSLRAVLRVLKNGHSVVIFPEGRITRTGGLMKVYQGVGFIALKTGATLIPVTIDGLERSKFSYLQDFHETTFFPKVRVRIDDPFTVEKKEISMRVQKEQVADLILSKLQQGRFAIQQKQQVNLFNELLEAGSKYGYQTIISEDINGKARYKDLLLNAYVLGHLFESLFKNEPKIGILMPNTNAHVVLLMSLFRIGKTPTILNFSVGPQTIQDNIETANIQTIITSKQFIKTGRLEHLVAAMKEKNVRIVYMDKEDGNTTITSSVADKETPVALSTKVKMQGMKDYLLKKRATATTNELILFTSGTESKPKGVVLSHDNMYANIYQCASVFDLTPKDKVLNVLPMFHSFGLTIGTLLPLLVGMPLYLYPNPLHYRVVPEIAYQTRSTVLFGTSTFLAGYAKYAHPYDFFKMRIVISGAEKLNAETHNLWFEKFGIRVLEGYGVTETAPVLSINTPLNYKKNTVGQLLPGLDYKIEPVEGIEKGGALVVKGPNVATRYLIHGQGSVPIDPWYNTGDVVEVDENRYITIKARLKRFAKLGGEMVSLNLVETVAIDCFKEGEFASIAIPDKRKGEQIMLYTTNKEAKKDVLRAFIKDKGHSPMLTPLKIVYLEQIPLLGTGKTDYVSLQELSKTTE